MVTGGAGFLGRRVVERLRNLNLGDVFVPRSCDVDLTNEIQSRAYFADVRPTVVIHLAAKVGGIEANRLRPGTFFRNNMLMGVNVIEHSRAFGVDKVVIVGTVCAYPKFCPVPFREESLWDGYPEETNAPYGIAKKSLLVMSQAYRQEFGLNSVMVFPVNLYGPGDNFDPVSSHVIPAMIRKFVDAKKCGTEEIVLWGDGSATREFLYVGDAADGIVAATLAYNEADPVNLGSGKEISIKDLANKVASLVGYDGTISWDVSRPNGQPRRMLDTSRAKERFGFVATTDFESGLRSTIDWYRRDLE